MKITALFRTPPPINEIGELVLENKKAYCEFNSYPLIYDNSPVINKHFSWGVAERIKSLLDEDYDLILNTGTEYLFTNFNISAEMIMEERTTGKEDIFIIGETLQAVEGRPSIWFELKEGGGIDLAQTMEDKVLLCPIGMFIKNTPFTRKLFKDILNDSRFAEESDFNTMLSPFIDRFQLALSIYYDIYPSIREKFVICPVREMACLPEGDGEEYIKLRKIMKKVITHDYSEFTAGQYTTTIWCLSTGIDLPVIKTIINDNLKNVVK